MWEQLPTEAKNCHSLKSCKACKADYGSLASEFPARDKTAKSERKAAKENVTIDLKCATPNQAGKQILHKVGRKSLGFLYKHYLLIPQHQTWR